jgi:hypothetical protein
MLLVFLAYGQNGLLSVRKYISWTIYISFESSGQDESKNISIIPVQLNGDKLFVFAKALFQNFAKTLRRIRDKPLIGISPIYLSIFFTQKFYDFCLKKIHISNSVFRNEQSLVYVLYILKKEKDIQ